MDLSRGPGVVRVTAQLCHAESMPMHRALGCSASGCHQPEAPTASLWVLLSGQREQCAYVLRCPLHAGRLVEIGVSHAFGVPGDFNLSLLDQLVAKEGLQTVW